MPEAMLVQLAPISLLEPNIDLEKDKLIPA